MSFHPSDEGVDDLDVTLIKYIKQYPGICVKELANCMTFYNKDKPAEEIRAKYHTIYYRIRTLENNKFIVTRREPSDKAMERKCFPR